MLRNEFQNCIFRSQREMLDTIAEEWLSAGGSNSEETQRAVLADMSDAELAAEAIEGWGLNFPGDFGGQSHMEFNEYAADDLAAAFERLRERMGNVAGVAP